MMNLHYMLICVNLKGGEGLVRVDGSMPSGASKTSSTTVKESVSSNGQSSDFNKVLKSSVKSNNNFDKASKSSTEKNSTYSQNNIKSKNSDDTKI